MARVFNFPGFRLLKNGAAAIDQGVAAADEDVRALSPAGGDWSQQELADLYRVEALLVQANIRIDTERGVTDEGDPWFVFCRADGEVFVHLSRFDGSYLLDSPGLDAPIRGADFAALIDTFVKRIAERAGTGNVVQFRRGRSVDGVVRLHPAVMLAALIWSLYLASDHVIGVAEAAGAETFPLGADGETDAVVEGDAELAISTLEEHSEPAPQDNYAPDMRAAQMQSLTREADVARMATEARGGNWNAGHASVIAASLSAVAIAYGMHEQNFVQTRSNDASEKSAGDGIAQADTLVIAAAEVPVLLRHDDTRDGHAPEAERGDVVVAHAVDLVLADVQQAALSQDALYMLSASAPAVTLDAPEQLDLQQHARPVPAGVAASQPEPAAKVAAQDHKQSVKIVKADAQDLVHFASAQLGQMSTYKIGGVSLEATFDIGAVLSKNASLALAETAGLVLADANGKTGGKDASDGLAAATLLLDALDEARPSSWMSQFNAYDAHAKSFIQNFLTKSADTVEMIQRDSTLIMIDMSAIDGPDDVYYSHGWIVDQNTVLTVIGHLQDFVDFGLATA